MIADVLDTACVVIVDDEPANVRLLERMLTSVGATDVHGITDPRGAVQRCLDVGADVILLDLRMPHMDGFAVMEELRTSLPEDTFLPVLVLTADHTTSVRDRALQAGASDFLTKPFDRTEVLLRVRNILQTRALYLDVQRRNTELKAELERRAAHERRLQLERQQSMARIDGALTRGALSMVFQPIADLNTGTIVGAEALARFHAEPTRPPNLWFDEAESVGRSLELELAAAAAALEQLGKLPRDAFVTVNVSPATATAPALARLLDALPADRIVLELTEHTRVDDYQGLLGGLAPLRQRGIRIAVDDAGAGYSGLRHVLRLQPDIIKLDIDLISDIHRDPAKRALSTALVTFATETRAMLIAEGIETPSEMAALRALGVPWGQGYHLARPSRLPLQTIPREAFAVDAHGSAG